MISYTEIIEAAVGPEKADYFYFGQVVKYLVRYKRDRNKKDIENASLYLDKIKRTHDVDHSHLRKLSIGLGEASQMVISYAFSEKNVAKWWLNQIMRECY